MLLDSLTDSAKYAIRICVGYAGLTPLLLRKDALVPRFTVAQWIAA